MRTPYRHPLPSLYRLTLRMDGVDVEVISMTEDCAQALLRALRAAKSTLGSAADRDLGDLVTAGVLHEVQALGDS